MEKNFEDLLSKHSDRSALVVAHGPSFNPFISRIEELSKKHILIGCNEWFNIYDTYPKYWVMASNDDTMLRYRRIINEICMTNTEIIYSDSVDITDKSNYHTLVSDWYTYDQRHFGGKKCEVCDKCGCSKYLNPGRLTIQEYLQKHCNMDKHYSSGSSVVLHALACAVLMGCNPIYVVGNNINYYASETGYCETKKIYRSQEVISKPIFSIYHQEIIDDFKTINDSANNIGVSIISLHPDCCHEIFPLGTI